MDPGPIGDTVQAVNDTMLVVKSQSDTALDWLSFIGTAVVAVFTGGYLYYTYCIYQETQKQSRSAEASAAASQEAAEASKEALEEQKQVNEQRRIERTHPLLWLNVKRLPDGLELRLENGSDVPAMDVFMFICARYLQPKPLFEDASRSENVDEEEDTELLMSHEEYGVHTGLTTEVIEGRGTSSGQITYTESPVKLYVFAQYRGIHGENFGRYFEVIGPPEPQHQSRDDSYFIRRTVPVSIEVVDRYEWVWREGNEGRREMLIREIDLSVSDWDALNSKYIHSDDDVQAHVGMINASLPVSKDTRALSSVEVLDRSEASFPFEVWFPRNWNTFEH